MSMEYEALPSRDFSDAVGQCPVSFLRTCRAETPLLRLTSNNPETNLLLVASSDAVLEVVRDARLYSSVGHPQAVRFDSDYDPQAAKIYQAQGCTLKNILVWSDGTFHSRVRKLVDRAFTAARVTEKSSSIQRMIDQLIAGFADGGRIDFIEQFSWQLPSMVITHEFDLPPSEVDFILEVTAKISAQLDPAAPPDSHRIAAPVVVALHQKLKAKIADPAAIRPDSLLRHLVDARLDGEPALSEEELLSMSTLLLIAGSHTTGAMLAWSLYILAMNQPVQQRLREDAFLVECFIEEVLRLHGPVPTSYRTATEDAELAGAQIPKGTWLLVRWDSINLDEKRWPDAEEFDLDRADVKRHSTFGAGAHFCIGNALGRHELVLSVRAMLRHFSRIKLAVLPEEVALFPTFDIHMPMSLPLLLER